MGISTRKDAVAEFSLVMISELTDCILSLVFVGCVEMIANASIPQTVERSQLVFWARRNASRVDKNSANYAFVSICEMLHSIEVLGQVDCVEMVVIFAIP